MANFPFSVKTLIPSSKPEIYGGPDSFNAREPLELPTLILAICGIQFSFLNPMFINTVLEQLWHGFLAYSLIREGGSAQNLCT